MKNKIIMLFILICSTFFFVSFVSADTYTLTFPDFITSIDEEDFNTMFNTISNNNITNNYMIEVQYNRNTQATYYNLWTFNVNSITINDSTMIVQSSDLYRFSSDFSSISSVWSGQQLSLNIRPLTITHYFLYSTIPINFSNTDNYYDYTYIDKTYNMPTSDLKFITVYEMYNDYYNPYPVLSNFISLVIDRLDFTANYFTSNYIYLSIFVILFFYFSILLVRRLL